MALEDTEPSGGDRTEDSWGEQNSKRLEVRVLYNDCSHTSAVERHAPGASKVVLLETSPVNSLLG